MLSLLALAIPVACVSWTVTHEEIFRELQQWCKARSQNPAVSFVGRKLYYIFTCEYCFSHYVAMGVLGLCAASGSRGGTTSVVVWLLDWFTLVWVANIYMSLYFRLRMGIRLAGARAKELERYRV